MATIDVSSYPSTTAANAAWSAGDTLYIPNGTYTCPTGGFVLTGNGEIWAEAGAVMSAASTTDPMISIQLPASSGITDRIWLHGGKWQGTSSSANSGNNGIICTLPSTGTGAVLRNLVIENMNIGGCGDDSIHLEGSTNPTAVANFQFPVIRNTRIENGYGIAVYVKDINAGFDGGPMTGGLMDTVYMLNHTNWGSRFLSSQCIYQNCYWEHNATVNTQIGQAFVSSGNYLFLGCHFENFAIAATASGSARAIVAQLCHGLTTWGGSFSNGTEDTTHTERRAIYVTSGSEAAHVVIGPTRISEVTQYVELVGVQKAEIYEPYLVNNKNATSLADMYSLPVGMHLKKWS